MTKYQMPTKFEIFPVKHIIFPLCKKFMSWERAFEYFEKEGRSIINLVKDLDNNQLFKKVHISKTMGLEECARNYSVAMVLWHLIEVGRKSQKVILRLSQNDKVDTVIDLNNFLPDENINNKNIVNEFRQFIDDYELVLNLNLENKKTNNYLRHPWFGKLNPHQWLLISALHQTVHKKQLKKILKKL